MNFYALFSNAYDILDLTYFLNKENNPRIAINTLIPDENVKVLDLCCGTLTNTIAIAKEHRRAKFLGIDLSKQMLQVAYRKIKKNKLNNIDLRRMDATNTSLKSDSFDYVVIGLTLHEMNPLLRRNILKEAYRILKSDGRLIVLEWERPKGIVQRLFYFPLMLGEQILCRSFTQFYRCDKKRFFEKNGFIVCNTVHCDYSAVFELKKRVTSQ